jgi:hypothetical protein
VEKRENLFSQLFKGGLQKKKKKGERKQTELHKQGLPNLVSFCNKQVNMSTTSWTAEVLSYPVAVAVLFISNYSTSIGKHGN